MKNYKIYCILLICLCSWNSSFAQCTTVIADTVYVTSTNNTIGSLHNAINCVNDLSNSIHVIHFNIPGAGVKTIAPTGAASLPTITNNNVVIDARTQPGWSLGNIVITPGAFGNTNHALRIQSNGVEVYGLTISGFTDTSTGAGIFLSGSNALIEENALIGNNYGIRTDFGISFTANDNFIGVDPVTNAADGNLVAGISIGSSTGTFEINRNTIAFNPRGIVSAGSFATVLISENSFYCNTIEGIDRGGFTAPGFTLTDATTRAISGNGTNGHFIEVFSHDVTDCPTFIPCQGKTFLGSTMVSGGNWTLDVADGVLQNGDEVTATATVGANNTSEFTACQTVSCPSASISFSDVINACTGSSTGSATANVSIAGSYTYNWSNGQTGATASNLVPATYIVSATDASSCIVRNNVTIVSLAAPEVDPLAPDPLCAGENLFLDANASNGTPAYTYEWEGPDNFTSNDEMPSIINVDIADEGTFFITVTDQNLCQVNGSVFVEINELPTFGLTPQNISCFEENDGMIELNPIIIATPESYEWSNGFFTQNIDGLDPGIYTVTLTDVNNCEATESTNITEPPVLVLSNLIPTSPTNLGGNDGSLMFDINGGTAPYDYSWSGPVNGNSNQPVAGMVTINDLQAGDYTLAITDVNMCTLSQNFTIAAFGGCMMSISTSEVNHISCADAMNGSINITIMNGTAPITYNWDNGAMAEDISGLSPADYALTATDANNCEVTFSASITEPSVLVLSNLLPSSPSSLGGNDGSLMFDTNGGTAPYVYAWSGPVNGNSNQPVAGMVTINDLQAGDYTLAITDVNMCTLSQNFTIAAFGSCMMSISTSEVNHISCASAMNGNINITIMNGTNPIIYNWDNGAMTEDISGLSPANYALTATDANNCEVTFTASITEPPVLVLSNLLPTSPTSLGANDGSLMFDINGGTAPYAYVWSGPVNGDSDQPMAGTITINNLQAGDYTLAITDANMCTLSQNFTIAAFGGCSFAIEDTAVMDINCSGQSGGSISITTINGTGLLSYQWTSNNMSGNGSGSIINNLPQGTYDITLTDQGGCLVTTSLSVNVDNNPSGVLNFIQGEEELCQGETLLLSTNVINNPDIIYYWRVPNGDTITSMTANLLIENIQTTDAGDYYVFAQDGFCIIDETGPFNLTVLGLPPGEQIYGGMDTVICDNQLQLNAAQITQGTGSWLIPDDVNIDDPNVNNPLVTNLQNGDNQFIWMVNTAACGNIGSDTINVLVVTDLQAEDDFFTLEQANSEIFMAVLKNDGFPENSEFTLTALTQPQFGSLVTLDNGFQYFETEGQRGTVTFDYQVCFSDTSCPMSCATATVTIEVLNLPFLPEGFTPNGDGLNDFLEIQGYNGGGNISMKISITNRWGDIVYYSEDYLLESPWNGHNRNNSNPLAEGTYYAWMEIEVDGEMYQQTQPIYLIK